jgi:hypothetical protein
MEVKQVLEILGVDGIVISFWSNPNFSNVKEVPFTQAYECLIKYDKNCSGLWVKLPKKFTVEWVHNQIIRKIQTQSIDYKKIFNKGIKDNNLRLYPTTYGFGISTFQSSKTIAQEVDKVREFLGINGIEYKNEYSEQHYAYRFVISKSKDNLQKLVNLQ